MFANFKAFCENQELVEEVEKLWGDGKHLFDCYSKYI